MELRMYPSSESEKSVYLYHPESRDYYQSFLEIQSCSHTRKIFSFLDLNYRDDERFLFLQEHIRECSQCQKAVKHSQEYLRAIDEVIFYRVPTDEELTQIKEGIHFLSTNLFKSQRKSQFLMNFVPNLFHDFYISLKSWKTLTLLFLALACGFYLAVNI